MPATTIEIQVRLTGLKKSLEVSGCVQMGCCCVLVQFNPLTWCKQFCHRLWNSNRTLKTGASDQYQPGRASPAGRVSLERCWDVDMRGSFLKRAHRVSRAVRSSKKVPIFQKSSLFGYCGRQKSTDELETSRQRILPVSCRFL